MALSADMKEFPQLSHQAFQHPLDRQAIESLSKIPLLPQFTRFLSEKVAERFMRIKHVSLSIRVNARQYPSCSSNLRGAQLVCGQCRNAVETAWNVCPGCGHHLQAASA